MSTVQVYCSNGVSFGTRYTIPEDASTAPETVLFDFMPSGTVDGYDIVAAITVVDSAGVVKTGSDEVITYPTYGQVMIGNGVANFTMATTDIISVIAQRAT